MDLLKDNLKKLYFKFLIPSLGSAMVMSIYTLTDAIIIEKGVDAARVYTHNAPRNADKVTRKKDGYVAQLVRAHHS